MTARSSSACWPASTATISFASDLRAQVHAPTLIDAEVSSVVRGLTITTKPNVQITADRAQQMLTDYAGLRIVRHSMQPLEHRVFELRHNFTSYDAMYVALAEALDIPLLTEDGSFATTPGHRAYHDWTLSVIMPVTTTLATSEIGL